MKNKTDKNVEIRNKLHKKIWKSLNIDKSVKLYGFPNVKSALTKWVLYQQTNAKLLKEKRDLENKLAEIDKKL